MYQTFIAQPSSFALLQKILNYTIMNLGKQGKRMIVAHPQKKGSAQSF